jgi:hypothetical protein
MCSVTSSDVKVHLRIDQARVVQLNDNLIEHLAARVAHVALAPVQPPQRATMAGVATRLLRLAGDEGTLPAGSDATGAGASLV